MDRLTPTVPSFDYRLTQAVFLTTRPPAAGIKSARSRQPIDSHFGRYYSRRDQHLVGHDLQSGHGGSREVANLNVASGHCHYLRRWPQPGRLRAAGEGGTGGYRVGGSSSWFNLIASRGTSGAVSPSGVAAWPSHTDQSWFFSSAAAGLSSSQVDFYTVATHELGPLCSASAPQRSLILSFSGRSFTRPACQSRECGVSPSLSSDPQPLGHRNASSGQSDLPCRAVHCLRYTLCFSHDHTIILRHLAASLDDHECHADLTKPPTTCHHTSHVRHLARRSAPPANRLSSPALTTASPALRYNQWARWSA